MTEENFFFVSLVNMNNFTTSSEIRTRASKFYAYNAF